MPFRNFQSFWPRGANALLVGWLLACASSACGQDVELESTGARFGFSLSGAGRAFRQAEAFVNWSLPWSWELGSQWWLKSRADVSVGWIGDSGDEGAVLTLGPTLCLGRQPLPVFLDCGLSPTFLSRSTFVSKDLGGALQFTSHIGLNLDLSSRIRLSYRFQHLSNGDLGRHNPGLNLQMIGLSYVF